MSIKFVLAISLFCCVFLAPIYCQSQNFDDKKFREAKERDKYKPPVPLPTLRPQNQPSGRGNVPPAHAGWQTTPRPQTQQPDYTRNQNNLLQNSQQLEPLFYYPRYERQEFQHSTNCISSPSMLSCLISNMGYQMSTLAADIPDTRRPPSVLG